MTGKVREPIALRVKELKNGRKSLYLDTYVEGVRGHSYEFLRLYLVPERTKADKEKNKQTLEYANAIKAQRLLERSRGKAGLPRKEASKICIIDYIDNCCQYRTERNFDESTISSIKATRQHLIKYSGTKTLLSQIDKEYLCGFIQYLSKANYLPHKKEKSDKRQKNKLATGSASAYFGMLTAILNQAVRDELIQKNPVKLLSSDDRKPIAYRGAHRDYLTIDEVNKLANVDCKRPSVKAAFMFSCYSGLRISDIKELTWNNIVTDSNGKYVVNIVMEKTEDEIYVPLGNNALKWLPERGAKRDDEYVFALPKTTINYHIKKMCKLAGINKPITYHTSRHTFATMLLTKGADLYTTSKLLGHHDIKVTQVYAEIIDNKKTEAIKLLDGNECCE